MSVASEFITAPVTGDAEIDHALASVADLTEVPLHEHHGRLQAAQDTLVRALESSREAPHNPVPQGLRPRG